MEISLTLMVQTTLNAESDSEYETLRDELLNELERMGFSVNIASEESDDGWLNDEHEREDDYYGDDDDEENEEDDEDNY